ncbi:uncharacterized protein LOC124188019 [Neodiprion fabricii]|uniref:uncharacterized protein LOC124188019 n=1 Tax=Neodiprion fabricii TaxID=2872261 RepID=UPI001ED8E635|nr:uncharacterized protein LOC124188019 [Neodiprion fabricii]
MRIPRRSECFLVLALLGTVATTRAEEEDDLDDVGFEDGGDLADDKISTSLNVEGGFFEKKELEIRNAVLSAVKVPEKQAQLSQVLPIIRSMSPPQKRAMAVLVTTRMSHNDTTLPFDKVEALFGGNDKKNVTRDLMLPISMDIAKIIADDIPEDLPEAQELRYYVPVGKRRRPQYYSKPRRPSTMNRRNVHPDGPRPTLPRPGRRPTDVKRSPTEQECTFFTSTVCLEAADYPHEAILRSIRSNREMISALLADYKSQSTTEFYDDRLPVALPLENKFENRFESNEIKRSDNNSPYAESVEEGFTCPSQIRYARPQLARAASGDWKYIINTGEHTQTLRLEKCTKPQSSCSFVSENYKSSCTQVFTYHRLLTWDTNLGLHMDIFKVPTCCSCHVLGYSDLYPPHRKNPPSKLNENFPGADFAAEDQADKYRDFSNPGSNFISKKSPSANFESSYVSGGSNPSYVDDAASSANYNFFEKKPNPNTTPPGRPVLTPTLRTRAKKPSGASRPFDNLPQQHAPNTRAPGYTGPASKHRSRPNRPFRRESNTQLDYPGNQEADTTGKRYSQQFDQAVDATTRVQSVSYTEEYEDPPRRVNYNYHPIIDFFKPEASMLQSVQPQMATQPAPVQSSNAWKPIVSA